MTNNHIIMTAKMCIINPLVAVVVFVSLGVKMKAEFLSISLTMRV